MTEQERIEKRIELRARGLRIAARRLDGDVVTAHDGLEVVSYRGPNGAMLEAFWDETSRCRWRSRGDAPHDEAMDHLCRTLGIADWREPPPPEPRDTSPREYRLPMGPPPIPRAPRKRREPAERAHKPRLVNVITAEPATLVVDDVTKFVLESLPPRELVLGPILHKQGQGMVYGWRGVGKTHIVQGSALAIAGGGSFLRWKADRPRRVALIDGEMPARLLQDRLRTAMRGIDGPRPAEGFLKLVAMDRQALGFTLNLANPAHQALVEAQLADAEVLFIDNLATLVRHGGDDNSIESWEAMQAWLLRLRRKGLTTLLVHHAGKSGSQRGSSAREDTLDTVIELKRPEDYQPQDGARFEVSFPKARSFFGSDARPFEAKLETRDGVDFWSCTDLRDLDFERVRELSRAGRSVREIEAETGISKSRVDRMRGRLREEGGL